MNPSASKKGSHDFHVLHLDTWKKTQHLRSLVNSSGGWYSLHLSFSLPENCEVIQNLSEMPKPADLDDRGCYKEHHESEGVCPNPVGERGETGGKGSFFSRGGKVSQIISSLYIESGQRRGFWRAIAKVYKTLSIKLMTIPTIEENHHPSRLTSDFGWSLTSFVPVTTQVFLLCLQRVDVWWEVLEPHHF